MICAQNCIGVTIFLIFKMYFIVWGRVLHWVFIAACRLSGCSEQGLLSSCGVWASHCSGFSCCRARAAALRVSSCSMQALLLHCMWDLPGAGIRSVSPTLAGGFLTTGPPGKSKHWFLCYRELALFHPLCLFRSSLSSKSAQNIGIF